jgi:hypothetical protein
MRGRRFSGRGLRRVQDIMSARDGGEGALHDKRSRSGPGSEQKYLLAEMKENQVRDPKKK